MATNTNTMMTHKYIPRIQQREENLFVEEYYSGTDTKVYLNDGNEPAEIAYISFSVNEQLKPIYGYASRTFDDMAVGSRIVTGIFKMPIKNPSEQDTYETVVGGKEPEKTTLEEIEDKNQKEETIKNNTEWVNNKNVTEDLTADYIYILDYKNNLLILGYSPDISTGNTYDSITTSEIKKFQTDNNLQTTGQFDNDTVAIINAKMEMIKYSKRRAGWQTLNVHAGPFDYAPVIKNLIYGQEFYIIQEINGFTQVRTPDGKTGFIETSKIPEA